MIFKLFFSCVTSANISTNNSFRTLYHTSNHEKPTQAKQLQEPQRALVKLQLSSKVSTYITVLCKLLTYS